MDKYTMQAMNDIIEYMYDDEFKSYEESNEEEKKNHIFNQIELVSEWLKDKVEKGVI